MQEALRNLPRRAAAAIALLILATAAACDDSIPAVQPAAVDPAPLEDAAERVQAAADRLDRAAEQLKAAPASDAIIINKDALRLLALLSQLQIELGIIDALINPPPDIRPSRWPLEPEDGAALGFASTRLFWIHHQLSTFAASPTASLPMLQEEETLALLAALQGELQIIGRSAYAVWKAHEAGQPTAPATPPLTLERTEDIYQPQTRIDQLIEAVGAFLATNGVGAAALPGATWNAVNALERLDWAARGNCFVWDCHGGSDFGDRIDFRERVLAVYSAAEFRRASAEARGYSGAEFDGAHCRRSVKDARSALSTASFTWSQYASRFRDVDFTPRDDGLSTWPQFMLSPSSLYRRALLACTLSLASNEKRP